MKMSFQPNEKKQEEKKKVAQNLFFLFVFLCFRVFGFCVSNLKMNNRVIASKNVFFFFEEKQYFL